MASAVAAAAIEKNGHTVTTILASQATPDECQKADCILLACPSWNIGDQDGQPHEDFVDLFHRFKNKKIPKNFAVLGLGDTNYTHFCGAVPYLETFIKDVGGTCIVPSLKIDQYYQNESDSNTKIQKWITSLLTK